MIYLQRKYPLLKHKIDTILLVSFGIALVIYILQPFKFDLYEGNKFLASLGFGVITFVCMCFFNYVIKKRISKKINKWTILYEILYIVCLILFITILNFLYFSVVLTDYSFNIVLLLYVVYYTFIIGSIPAIILVFIKYNNYLNKQLNILIDTTIEEENIDVTISNHLIREKNLKIKLNDFIFAEVIKNDVIIYYLYENEVKMKTLRSTIATVSDELKYPNIFRCHRSFIVNLKKMQSAKGNSNGYQIYLNHYQKSIPVSRKYVDELKQLIY